MTTGRGKAAGLAEMEVGEALAQLSTNLEGGLTGAEVQARLAQYGYNEVLEQRADPWLRFASKFWGLTAWMLELIIILSLVLHKWADLYVVTGLLVANALLSFFQDQGAAGVVETLRRRLQVNARVRRDGAWSVVPGREIVPGDVVRVRSGDLSPADVRIVAGTLGVDQAALTGESLEVEVGPGGILYSGAVVRRGEATGVAILTGRRTYFGRTAELVQIARPRLHVEEVISRVVHWLFVIVGALLAVALATALVKGVPLFDILSLLLVLLLGAVPVALPVMFTVSMAVASRALAKKGVLVTRLSAAEDAANMDVLCVDKTGTITTNELAVAAVMPLAGAQEWEVLLNGAMASQEANQDPIDLAFIRAARARELLGDGLVQTRFVPFDPSTRRTEATVREGEHEFRVMKGALQAVAAACGLGAGEEETLAARAREGAARGQRTLAVARGENGEAPHLVGLVALSDMPRPDSRALIENLKALGVAVKMLTGDAQPIAREVAEGVGLGTNVVRVGELEALAAGDPARAGEMAEAGDGFAEVYPEDKYTVVKSLQARGHVVGMTGDGVNDAPALRQAEVGIAVSSASDVAKGAASVVLTDEGLSGIVVLVEQGRMIHQRIATWIINKISRTILKTAFVVFAFLFTGKFVISAFAMMVMVLMTDFVKISLSTDNVRWSQKPERWNILALVKVAVIFGVLMVVEAFGLLYIGWHHLGLASNEPALCTFAFETLFYFAMFSIFAVRERRHFWQSRPSKTMLVAIGVDLAIGTTIATLGIPGLAPLPIGITLFVLGYAALTSLVINDLVKCAVMEPAGINW